jgi:hypothetical protein
LHTFLSLSSNENWHFAVHLSWNQLIPNSMVSEYKKSFTTIFVAKEAVSKKVNLLSLKLN